MTKKSFTTTTLVLFIVFSVFIFGCFTLVKKDNERLARLANEVNNTWVVEKVEFSNENGKIMFPRHIIEAKEMYASVILKEKRDDVLISSNYVTDVARLNDLVYYVRINLKDDIHGKVDLKVVSNNETIMQAIREY